MYTLDTNTIIYYLDSDERVLAVLRDVFERGETVYISTISELELFGFPRLSAEEADEIERVLQTVSIIPLDSRIARIAAGLRKNYGVKTLDSAIAATAIFTGTILLTRNIRDFKKIPNLRVEKV